MRARSAANGALWTCLALAAWPSPLCAADAAPTTLVVESSAFRPGESIPRQFAADGRGLSPELRWRGAPPETKQFVVICEDLDAGSPRPWTQWVIYNLPRGSTGLPSGIPPKAEPTMVPGALQGLNSWNTIGYHGPAPKRGTGVHHYRFRVYALGAEGDLPRGLDREGVLRLIRDYVLAVGETIGAYQR